MNGGSVHLVKNRIILICVFVFCFSCIPGLDAAEFYYSEDNTVIGSVKTYITKEEDSLIEIARQFGIGYNEIAAANPDLDPFVPGAEEPVTIPTSWILPDVNIYDGIVINLSEMRLYYFFKKGKKPAVATFPIGIGSEGNDTPLGEFRVIQKIVKPSWHPPKSIREEHIKEGLPVLPPVVPPGPDNPLGSHALRLSLNTVLIHGTNKPFGVGRRVSHGCIRLYPEDIPKLYEVAGVGSRVTIVRQPFKVGSRDGRIYIEVYDDENFLLDRNFLNSEVVSLLLKKGYLKQVNSEKLHRALEEKRGIPVDISD